LNIEPGTLNIPLSRFAGFHGPPPILMFFFRTRSEIIDGIEVRGTARFRSCTQESLSRLRSTPEFDLIRANLGIIRQGKRSGMKAWREKPTFVVGARTWKHSVLWYAGAIAHDAYHAKLYLDARRQLRGTGPDADAWTGIESEKQCLSFQRGILARLGADEKTLAYIDQWLKHPTYQGHHKGWKSWLDYLKRRW
jgi:hypothetical protein